MGPEPVKEITHFTGEWTLIFICLTLSMSPLKKITNMSIWINFRRMLGLFVFFYATLHLLTYVGLDYRFNWQPIMDDVVKKRYVFIGFAAWLLLVPLAITSSKKTWQKGDCPLSNFIGLMSILGCFKFIKIKLC